MELLLALLIVPLAAIGLAMGLILGRDPVRTSCDGMRCINGASCATCPRRAAGKEPR